MAKFIAIFLIRIYQLFISPLKIFLSGQVHSCRFHPSCSDYAMGCFKKHSFFKAMGYTLKRLVSCHPFHDGGHDPVP